MAIMGRNYFRHYTFQSEFGQIKVPHGMNTKVSGTIIRYLGSSTWSCRDFYAQKSGCFGEPGRVTGSIIFVPLLFTRLQCGSRSRSLTRATSIPSRQSVARTMGSTYFCGVSEFPCGTSVRGSRSIL